MATIQSSLQIYDRMTGPLMAINNAMNIVINSFESMQSASHGAVDTASLSAAREQLASAEVEINQISRGITESSQHQESFNNNIADGSNYMGEMKQKVMGVAAAYLSIQGGKNTLNLSDELTQTTARLNMMNDGLQTTDELQNMIFESAQRSRTLYMATADVVAKLGQRAGDAFSSNKEIIAFSENLNKMFVIAGASQAEIGSASLQLTQALGSGVLRGEEFNAVFEAAPNVMQAVADYIGQPIGKLKDMASEGQLTSEIIINSLLSATDKVNEQFGSMPVTFGQVAANIQNVALNEFQPIIVKLSEITQSKRFTELVTSVANSMVSLANVIGVIFDTVSQVGAFLYDNWSIIEPIIAGVATALAIYAGYLLVTNAIELISNGIKIAACLASFAHAAATRGQASGTALATAAQYGFNTALLACPLTWIIIAIIAVVVAIYAIVAAINKVTGSTYSATEIICGAIAAAGAFIINLVIGVLNGIIQLAWTILAEPLIGIVEWILNIMGGGFDSFGDGVKNLLGNIISWFLSLGKVVTKIIDAIFGTDWTSGLSSLQDNVLSWGKNENAITLSREAPEIDYRMEYGDAWNAGKEFGKGIDRALEAFDPSKMSNGSEDAADQIGNPGAYTPTSGTDDALGKINDDTSAIKDSVSVSEEDLKYLREIAEKDAVNRFTTAEIKIDMTNHNTINSDNDIDGVISTLENKLYQSMIVAKEGV